MLAGMSEVNALLLWRRFKPGEEMRDASLFRRRLAYSLLNRPVRLVEREESLALSRSRRHGIVGGPEHFVVLNPLGTRNRIKRLHCRFCDKKSAYSCGCSPFVAGMNPRDAMAICSDRQGGRCMLRHRAGETPPRKRQKAARKEWTSKTRSSAKSASDGAEGSGGNA